MPDGTRHRESWWLEGLYRDECGYYRYDGELTCEQFTEAVMALDRNEGPALLHDLSWAGSLSVCDCPGAVAVVWCMAEFPVRLLPADVWVSLFEEAGYTTDGVPAPQPTEPVTVYRGCSHERRFGMSWTTDPDRARWFAERDLGRATGHIYVCHCPPEALLAYIHEEGRREAEHVVDPAYLTDDVVRRLNK